MLDMELIEDSIVELEQDATSYENCIRLASLYICREINKNRNMSVLDTSNDVSHDSNDLFSTYNKYIDAKMRYQQYEVVDKMLIYAMSNLCHELTDFISNLYHNTETTAERALIVEMINNLRSAI